MNSNIRKLLEAIEILRDVQGTELERASLAHKIQALYSQDKDGLTGVDLIDAMKDEELEAAIRLKDERIGLHPHICPDIFNYLKRNRSKALYASQNLPKL